jgi:carbonic anhydrase/acetyltransferase-like protein (isoleucine patch superfamily)
MRPDQLLPTRLEIDPTAFVAETCVLRGRVRLGASSSAWFQAVLRGDSAPIRVGDRTNIQDGCILHTDLDQPVEIGDDVTVGHGAIVHGATVAGEVLIAMRATVLSGAVIGRRCIIGAGAVVTEGTRIPEGSLVLGIPARVIRPLREEEVRRVVENARAYVVYAEAYRHHRVAPPRPEEA